MPRPKPIAKYFATSGRRFILGLTATSQRPDGQSVLNFFQDATHRMTLEEAVRRGELASIRCVVSEERGFH